MKQPQKLKRGFGSLKEIFFDNGHILNEMDDTIIFADFEKDDDNTNARLYGLFPDLCSEIFCRPRRI